MAISLRLSNEDTALIRNYAKLHGISVSELMRQAVMDKIEDEYDLAAYEKAMRDYASDPETYTLDQVEKELGIA